MSAQSSNPLHNIPPVAAQATGADFVMHAAGELGDPVAAVVTDIAALKNDLAPVLSPEQRLALDRASVSASRLASSIATISTASRHDASRLTPVVIEIPIDDIYATVSSDLTKRALVTKRLLGLSIPHDLPAVAADPLLIGQVFTALVDNALLHSREGGQVAIRAALDGEFVKVSVVDHGDGIGSRDIDSLFNKFFRTEKSHSLYAGAGLGLYASRAIIERHKGQIGVVSVPGEGTTVTFTLPVFRALDRLHTLDDDVDKYAEKV